MYHHREINELKVGGHNIVNKEPVGGEISSKIWRQRRN